MNITQKLLFVDNYKLTHPKPSSCVHSLSQPLSTHSNSAPIHSQPTTNRESSLSEHIARESKSSQHTSKYDQQFNDNSQYDISDDTISIPSSPDIKCETIEVEYDDYNNYYELLSNITNKRKQNHISLSGDDHDDITLSSRKIKVEEILLADNQGLQNISIFKNDNNNNNNNNNKNKENQQTIYDDDSLKTFKNKKKFDSILSNEDDDGSVFSSKRTKSLETSPVNNNGLQYISKIIYHGNRQCIKNDEKVDEDKYVLNNDDTMKGNGQIEPYIPDNEILFTYPNEKTKGAISITQHDKETLEPERYLNDNIINYYIKSLYDGYSSKLNDDSSSTPNGSKKITKMIFNNKINTQSASDSKPINEVHTYNTFFYTKISQNNRQLIDGDIYNNVKNWTKDVDLFEKKYVLIPINEKNHWYLILVTNLKACIPRDSKSAQDSQSCKIPENLKEAERSEMFVLDSLHNNQEKGVANIIKYLSMEAKYKRGVDFEDFIEPTVEYPFVPLQNNPYDCGIYVLHFAEHLMKNPRQFMNTLKIKYNDDKEDEWRCFDLDLKRQDLLDLVDFLKKK
ncbi:unnamed protein product [Cunninghamella echinulata]